MNSACDFRPDLVAPLRDRGRFRDGNHPFRQALILANGAGSQKQGRTMIGMTVASPRSWTLNGTLHLFGHSNSSS